MKQEEVLYLVVAVMGIVAGLLAVWVAMLGGFSVNTAAGIGCLVFGIVFLRRWWQGEK